MIRTISTVSTIFFVAAIAVAVFLFILDAFAKKISVPLIVYLFLIMVIVLSLMTWIGTTVCENQQIKKCITREFNAKKIDMLKDSDIIVIDDSEYWTCEYNSSKNQVTLNKINTDKQIVIDDVVD